MPFSQKALEFLSENYIRNDKGWYREHKYEYSEYVLKPLTELVIELQPCIQGIDDSLQWNPRKISRLYRDARYLKGKSIFRDRIWCDSHSTNETHIGEPDIFFELSPRDFRYGCCCYQTTAGSMEVIRSLMLKGDESFRVALAAYRNQNVFDLYGELYKRNRYPERSEELCDWLNRKSITVMHISCDFDLLFSNGLAQKIACDYQKIAPIFQFLKHGWQLSKNQ